MIEYLVIVESLRTGELRFERLRSRDIDVVTQNAVERFGGRGIVRAVVEVDDGRMGNWMRCLIDAVAAV